jgi:PAS domain S-box-containing protein
MSHVERNVVDLHNPQTLDFINQVALRGLWTWDIDNPAQYWNAPRIWELLGYNNSSDNINNGLGSWQSHIHPHDLAIIIEGFQLLIETKQITYEVVFRGRHKKGSFLWIKSSGILVEEADGQQKVVSYFEDITSQKEPIKNQTFVVKNAEWDEKEEELIRTQEISEQINQIALVGGWEVDWNTKQIKWSNIAKEIFEVSQDFQPDVLTGMEFYPDQNSKDLLINAISLAVKEGIPFEIEVTIETALKNKKWIQIKGQGEYLDGRCIRLYGTFKDIDQVKKTEIEIQRTNRLFKKLSDQVPGGLYQLKRFDDGRITIPFASDGLFELFEIKYEKGKTTVETMLERIHRSDLPIFFGAIEESFKNLTVKVVDFRIVVPNKGKRWVRGESTPERLENSVIWHGYLHDITRYKEVENEIVRSEAKFRALYNSTSDAVLVLNQQRCIDCNPAAIALFGASTKEAICKMSAFALSADKQKEGDMQVVLQEHIMKCLRESRHSFEWICKRMDNAETFPAEILLSKLNIEGEQLIQAVVRDITTRKRIEHEFLTAREHAEAASLAKSEFLANMSHEIRTPLNGVIGFTDLLMRTELAETQKQYVSTIFHSAHSLLDIINDILDFSKIEAGKLELSIEQSDIIELSSQVIDLIKYQAHEKNLEVLLNIASNVPRFIWADAVRLRQILVNLLSNAVKFTNNGEIELKVEVLEATLNDTCRFRFTVRDTGVGIAPKNSQKIFEAFAQEDASVTRKFGGTGLGLTISNQLLSLMDSSLKLESELGKGSTFCFELSFKTKHDKPIVWNNLTNIHDVMIVDDNLNNRLILEDMLALKNIQAQLSRSGIEALDLLTENTKIPDVVIVDYHMPYMNGIETIWNIRKNLGLNIPIILLHSSSDDEYINTACAELEVHKKLVKPITSFQLYDALSHLAKQGEGRIYQGTQEKGNAPYFDKQKYKILIAEDNNVNMLLATTVLTTILPNVEIIKAENGLEAVILYEKHHPDLILMDVQMPELNGYEATRVIRMEESGRHTPIIALTAGTVKGENERCLEAGMDDYVTKPFVRATIAHILEKWLDDKSIMIEEEGKNVITSYNEHLDWEDLCARMGDDPALAKEILEIVLEQIDEIMVQFKTLIEQGNLEALNRFGHKIKGTALSAGMTVLAKRIEKIEKVKVWDKDKINALLDAVEEEVIYLKPLIKQYLDA